MTSAMSSLWRQAAWCQWRWPWWPSTCPSPSCAASTSGSGGRQSRGRETWSTCRLVRRWARDRPPGKMMPICFRVCLWLMSYYTGYFNFSGEQEDHIFTATRLSVGTFQSKWAEKSFRWASYSLCLCSRSRRERGEVSPVPPLPPLLWPMLPQAPESAQPRWRSAHGVAAGQRRSAAEAGGGGHQTDSLALLQCAVWRPRGQGGQQVGEHRPEMEQQQRIPRPSEPQHG